MEDLSRTHAVPLEKWIQEGSVFKFWGDNVDKMMGVRDPRADHRGGMVHMFSMIVGLSRTPAPELSHQGRVSSLDQVPSEDFLPTLSDIKACFSKVVPKHILHRYSQEMARKSEVFALDALGEGYTRRVVSGGDYLTCERQRGAQLSTVCGATVSERLALLEPVNEDWHCLLTFLTVSR